MVSLVSGVAVRAALTPETLHDAKEHRNTWGRGCPVGVSVCRLTDTGGARSYGAAVQTLTLRAGGLRPSWHAAHIVLSVLTFGWWLPVYGVHALISTVTRPTVQVELPEGHRVEYRNGWPNVLGPDEDLEPRPTRERLLLVAGYASPALILAALIVGVLARD